MNNGQPTTTHVRQRIARTPNGRKTWNVDPDRNVELGLAILRNATIVYDEEGQPCAFKWPEKPENPQDQEWRRTAGMQPGDVTKFEIMAAVCGVSRQNMSLIFEKAKRKIRVRLYGDKTIESELKEYLEGNRIRLSV